MVEAAIEVTTPAGTEEIPMANDSAAEVRAFIGRGHEALTQQSQGSPGTGLGAVVTGRERPALRGLEDAALRQLERGEPRDVHRRDQGMTLRATQIYRREDREWRIVHRHGDSPFAHRGEMVITGSAVLSGGCLCGAVRYSVRGDPVHVRRCHCANCRKESGSAFSVYALWPTEAFELSGELSSYDGRDFCPRCGSRLLDTSNPGDTLIEIRLGSLDEAPFELKPEDEIWVKRRESWIPPVESAAQHGERAAQNGER